MEIISVPPLVALINKHIPIAAPFNNPPKIEHNRISFIICRLGIKSTINDVNTIIINELVVNFLPTYLYPMYIGIILSGT